MRAIAAIVRARRVRRIPTDCPHTHTREGEESLSPTLRRAIYIYTNIHALGWVHRRRGGEEESDVRRKWDAPTVGARVCHATARAPR